MQLFFDQRFGSACMSTKENCMKIFAKLSMLVIFGVIAAGAIGCAKKKNDESTRMRGQNQQVNPGVGNAAIDFAKSQGIEIDLESITPPVMDQNDNRVTSNVLITTSNSGQYVFPLTTFHARNANYLNPTSGQLNTNGLRLEVSAACTAAVCSPYYLMISVYQGSQAVIQMGVRKSFNSPSEYDVFQWMPGNQFLSFDSMRGYLDGSPSLKLKK